MGVLPKGSGGKISVMKNIIIPSQNEIRISANPRGGISINETLPDGTVVTIDFTRESTDAVIRGIREMQQRIRALPAGL